MTANQPVLSNLQMELLKLYANGISDKKLLASVPAGVKPDVAGFRNVDGLRFHS